MAEHAQHRRNRGTKPPQGTVEANRQMASGSQNKRRIRGDRNRARTRSRTLQQPRPPPRSRRNDRGTPQGGKEHRRVRHQQIEGQGRYPRIRLKRGKSTRQYRQKYPESEGRSGARHQTNLLRLQMHGRGRVTVEHGSLHGRKSSAAPYSRYSKVFSSTTVIWVRCASILRLAVPSP